jgi:hypothetical protein
MAAILDRTHKVASTGISTTIITVSEVSISEVHPKAVRDGGRADETLTVH